MSQQLINRSPDLKQLRDEGYHVEHQSGYLLIKGVPYITPSREVKRGTLVSRLTLSNNVTTTPDDHTVFFAGEYPCHQDGSRIERIGNSSQRQELAPGLFVDHLFSARPIHGPHPNYYSKMTTYIAILEGPAQAIDPSVSAQIYPVIEATEGESVFRYIDTASSRAGIGVAMSKLELGRVAIVGLGGTGAYVLDLVAKTPVKEIHLYDGDRFLQHNAFRSPGAPSGEELEQQPYKADYFVNVYSKMRRGVYGHTVYVDDSNVLEMVEGIDFVFLCIDQGSVKRLIVTKLEEYNIPFIDAGMGVYVNDGVLGGIIRITTSTPQKRSHVWDRQRIPFSDNDPYNEYNKNIQIADLNALNATLAVIKWKKLFGFYGDFDNEHYSTYTIDGNLLINEDTNEA